MIVGRWSDALGSRKPFLIGILLIFSACSILSGLATSYYMLLASRLIMGLAEGPLMPICLAILITESSPNRRGLNIGIVQSLFSSLLGATIAPVVLVAARRLFSWRVAFFLSGIPGILCALAIIFYVREPKTACPGRQAGCLGDASPDEIQHILSTQYLAVLCHRLSDGVLADASSDVSAPVFYHNSPFHRRNREVGS